MKKHKLIALLMSAFMLCTGMQLPAVADVGAGLTEISSVSPAIGADAGDTISLADYSYKGTALSEYTWSGVGSASLDGNSFKADRKGVYVFDGVKGEDTFRLFIVVKDKSETEYTLYENDFDDQSSLDDLSVVEGSKSALSVSDSKLTIIGDSVRVLLPELYKDFGNYKIDVNATIKNPANDLRWTSIMYRIKADSPYYPYYQMAVRSNATASNGVEFAKRTPSNAWNVLQTSPYTEKINPDKMYKFTVCAYGKYVTESIDDMMLLSSTGVSDITSGRIGLQANQCTMIVDSIKVTLQTEAPAGKRSFANVRSFSSKLATTPTLVSFVDTKADFDDILVSSPATAIFNLNSDGKVIGENGETIATLDEAYDKIGTTVIAAFRPDNEAAVDKLSVYCKQNNIEDVAVASDDSQLIKYAREEYYLFRGIVLFDKAETTEEGLLEMRKAVNTCGAKIAVLPYECVTKESVLYLQKLLVTVWAGEAPEESNTSLMTQILSGANGIVASDRAAAENCFTNYFETNSVTRQILVIGHRGLPSVAPENSIEGSALAYEAGADIVENDVYLTKDGVVVIMHDDTVDRTTNGTGNIESMTYEQVKALTLNAAGGLTDCKIPTLEEYFQAFGSLDKQLFIEIKTTNANVIEPMAKLIEEYNMSSKICFISFDTAQLARIQARLPEVSTGYLCSGLTTESNAIESVRSAVCAVQTYSSTFNQSSSGISKEFMTELNHRGVTYWPWTYTDTTSFATHYLWGINGFTTNYANCVTDTVKTVKLTSEVDTLQAGESAQLQFSAVNYNDKETALGENAEIVIIDGEDNVALSGNTITAKSSGGVSLYCRYKTTVGGKTAYACSDIVTIQTEGELELEPSEPTNPGSTDSDDTNNTGSTTTTPAVTNGTATVNGKTVLYVNGKAVTGTKVITVSGKMYAVVGGYVKTGKKQVVKIGSKYYIVNASGVVQKGTKNKLIKVGTKSYVVNKNGVVQRKASGKKLVKVGTKSYIVNKLGVVQKGSKNKLVKIGKKAYVVNKSGVVQKNKKSIKAGKKTYKTNKKGVATLKK